MVSAVGKDQKGIVAAFSQVLFENRCNIEDTSMTILEDQFAMLFIVTLPQGFGADDLQKQFDTALADFHMQVDVHQINTQRETLSSVGEPWMISVSSPDQTGIMYHVTRYLSVQQINVRHLSSKRLTRPSGETLFLMAIETDVPQSLSPQKLLADLQTLGGAEKLEIHAEQLETYTL
jgi:glycine cleavage system transcriptional repressor